MDWLKDLFTEESAAHAVMLIGLVGALGLAIGSIRIAGINLGIGGVLFSGLLFGHFNFHINHEVMEFVREFGLILFVYTIGLQVGPGFIASLRRQGLPLNLMAGAIVLLGAGVAVGIHYLFGVEMPVAVGLFSGGTTNTPSLAAAQQALKELENLPEGTGKLPGLGYAIAYPFGILGIILTMLATRAFFRIRLDEESEQLSRQQDQTASNLATMNLVVRNPNLEGVTIGSLPIVGESGVVVSRISHESVLSIARPETVLHGGDIILAVGPRDRLDQLRLVVGNESNVDLRLVPSKIITRRIIITRKEVLGKTIRELGLPSRYGVNITRVSRSEIDFAPTPNYRTQFGDTVLAVGDEAGINHTADELGNSLKQLRHPEVVPIFLGIVLGVILGSWPIVLPGMPAAVRLGLAGGPLLVAIMLSRIGRIGPLIWYMPISANFMLRELGIVMFLACVGLHSGDVFVETLLSGSGLAWLGYGAMITLIPLTVVALFARLVMKLNYLHLCGLLAGSMTDPPALAFATQVTASDSPSVAYSTVYPLVMLLRVICAQAMVLLFQ